MSIYVVTGGTGKTGRNISLGLLKAGHQVRIICRNRYKATDLIKLGAEVFTGDTRDVPFLKTVFTGALAAYILLPIDTQTEKYTETQVAHATALRRAVMETGIQKAVTLSSIGANFDHGNGVVLGLHRMEELFNEAEAVDVLHLRAGYFMENTLSQISMIREKGFLAGPENGAMKFAMVASADISEVALKRLLALDFTGKQVEYVLGSRDISYNEIAAVYGAELGLPDLKYVQLSEPDFVEGMIKMGVGSAATQKFYEFTRLVNEGKISGSYQRTPENTTPTSIEDFAQVFKALFEKQKK